MSRTEMHFSAPYEGDYFVVENGAGEFRAEGDSGRVEIFKVDREGKRSKILEVYDAGGYLIVEDFS
jgi:hypothetical protein